VDARKTVYRETAIITLGVTICVAVMLGVFALLGQMDSTVLLGSAIGTVLAIVNFFFMAVGVSLAADKAVEENVKGGKSLIKGSFLLRMLVIFVILFACAKSGLCNAVASVLPLAFVRPVITIAEFFRKTGEKTQ